MPPFEDIALKRSQLQAEQQARAAQQQNLDAIHGNGVEIVGATKGLAKTSDIDNIIQQMKQMQLDALVASQNAHEHALTKAPVILTDQTDLGDKMGELGDKLAATLLSTDSSERDAQQLSVLQEVKQLLTELIQCANADMKGDKTASEALLKAVKGLKLSPTVNVPAPKVTVEAPAIDLSPITEALKAKDTENDYDADDGVDLDDYRAQDISNSGKYLQYVGFLSPTGKWYIIENNTKDNKLRYVFGKSGYSEAFARASEWEYNLLDEAIHAISS